MGKEKKIEKEKDWNTTSKTNEVLCGDKIIIKKKKVKGMRKRNNT